MIRDLLDFTQARLGEGLRIECKPMKLEAAVEQVVAELQASYPERILFERVGRGDGCWDLDRLIQLTGNLVSNALEYSPPGSRV